MPMFIIDDTHLQRLSPAARRELLDLLDAELDTARALFVELDWDPEGTESYPLTVEEATLLLRGMPEPASNSLRVFVDNFDGQRGYATLAQLLDATGHSKFENVGKQLAWILLRVRSVTGHDEAWLVSWHTRDWIWDDDKQTYTDGKYYITEPAVTSLRKAFEAKDGAE